MFTQTSQVAGNPFPHHKSKKICAPSLRRGQGRWGPWQELDDGEFKDSQHWSRGSEDLENGDYQI
ncbi:hypothetical protein AAZX31_18G024200 [Glycine max]